MTNSLAGIDLAIKCLKNFETSIDPEINGRDAIRLARESIEETASIMGVKNGTP